MEILKSKASKHVDIIGKYTDGVNELRQIMLCDAREPIRLVDENGFVMSTLAPIDAPMAVDSTEKLKSKANSYAANFETLADSVSELQEIVLPAARNCNMKMISKEDGSSADASLDLCLARDDANYKHFMTEVGNTAENVELFDKMNVMSKKESIARKVILHDHYAGPGISPSRGLLRSIFIKDTHAGNFYKGQAWLFWELPILTLFYTMMNGRW